MDKAGRVERSGVMLWQSVSAIRPSAESRVWCRLSVNARSLARPSLNISRCINQLCADVEASTDSIHLIRTERQPDRKTAGFYTCI